VRSLKVDVELNFSCLLDYLSNAVCLTPEADIRPPLALMSTRPQFAKSLTSRNLPLGVVVNQTTLIATS